MLDWNDLHPYNAVHGVRISTPADLVRLKDAIQNSLEFHGLTGLTLDRKQGTFQYTGGPAQCEIKTIAATENPPESLRAEIERQVNAGFDISGTFLPFRFFVVPENESFYLGLVYFHAVADAVSIVHLLRHIYTAFEGKHEAGAGHPPSTIRHPRFSSLLTFPSKLAGLLAQVRQHRHSVRVAHRDIFDGTNRFEQFTLGPETLRALAAAAKAWNVTINDIFLAVLLLCCSPFALNRFREPSRGRLAIGCIVNTRSDLDLDDPQGWGLFLGSFVVAHETPDGISLQALAQAIRRQTLVFKRRKDYVGTSLELVLGRFLLAFFSTAYRTKLYQKHYPLWGGVTNMNLNTLWPQPAGAPPVDFFRGVSTGPVTPLVLSVTTVRDVVNVGLTFRATTFTDAHIGQVKKHFLNILEQLNPRA